MKSIAVVLLNWNGQVLLEQFLPKIIACSPQAQVYMIDNASTDRSVPFVQNNYPEVRVLLNTSNLGYAEGYNAGLQQVEEPYWCLLNTDVEVTPNWLDPIVSLLQERPDIGIIQPKISDYYKKDSFEYAGAAGGFIDRHGFAFCRGRLFSTLEKDTKQYQTVAPIFWASGACFFVRATVFQQLKGFDPLFFAHQEEIDLCWRAFNANIGVYYHGESTVYHMGGATLGSQSPQKTYLNFRNSLFMLYKNLPEKGKLAVLFQRLCLDGLAGVFLMLQLKPLHCFAIIKAHFAFYGMAHELENRVEKQAKSNYFYTRSVIRSYFIQRIKNFKGLPKA